MTSYNSDLHYFYINIYLLFLYFNPGIIVETVLIYYIKLSLVYHFHIIASPDLWFHELFQNHYLLQGLAFYFLFTILY